MSWPETELVLSRFRHWLDETRNEAEAVDEETAADALHDEVGLFQLTERLTSLRHEVKLLTKTSRTSEERNEATLVSMQAAMEQFRSVQADEAGAAERAARPLVEGLVDLDESLRRGHRVIENARTQLLAEMYRELTELRDRFEELYRMQPWWRRLLCRPWHAALGDIHSERTAGLQRTVFDSLLEGYDLIQSRLQRTLDEQLIVRMQCVGRPADPSCMNVLETVNDPGRPPGTVTEEIRTGYYWKSNVFRFAEVKAVGER